MLSGWLRFSEWAFRPMHAVTMTADDSGAAIPQRRTLKERQGK
jgi:hypothetical protein